MQLCLGQCIISIDVKAAEGKLAGPMIKNGLTTAVSKHKSDQDCYIPSSKDYVLTAVISSDTIKLRLHTVLHLVDGNCEKRILASKTYVRNVDSKPLCASPKVLNQVRCKDASQSQEQHPKSLQSVVRVKLVFGLQQWFKKIASLGEKEARGVAILGKDAPMSQHSSGSFCSNNSWTNNLSELYIDSSESYIKQTEVKNGSEYVKSSNNGAIAVANKEGFLGFNLSRSCVAETLLVTRCGPVLTSEFFSAPNSCADNFNGNSGNGVDINTCQINSLTTLSQLTNNAEKIDARSRITFSSHLCSGDSMLRVGDCKSERLNFNPQYVDINTCQINSVKTYSQLANDPKVLEARNRKHLPRHDICSGDSFKTCSALLSIGNGKSESLETNVCIKDQQAEKHISNTVWKNSIINSQIEEPFILQSGIIDRICSQLLYFMKVKSEEHVRSHAIGNFSNQVSTDKNQMHLSVNVGVTSFAGQSGSRDKNRQRNVICNTYCKSEMTIGSGLPSSCSFANRTDSTSSSLTKGPDTVVHGTGDNFGRNQNKDSGKRHTDQHSRESRKAKDKGIDDDGKVGHRTAAGESREAPSDLHKNIRSKSTMEQGFVRGAKYSGNSTASESSSCGSGQNIGPVHGYGSVGKGNNLCVWKKVQKHPEDGCINEPKLPSRAKEKQDTEKVNPHVTNVTKTRKTIWARKPGSSTMDDSKPFSRKEEVDTSQQSNCSKSTNLEMEETRIVSRSTPGTSKSVGQEMRQKQKQTNLTLKARASSITGKGLSCERNNERHHSSQQVAQKWVPVESKSGKASATDKAVADSHGSTVICRIADEVINKEDDSSGLSQASSDDTQIRDSSAKRNVPETAIRDSQSHTQSKILGYLLKALKETDTSYSDHIEDAVSETRLVSDAACMGIGNDSCLHDESNKKAQSVLKSIDSSYEYQMMSEHIAQGIGNPIAEFEKVLDAVSPVVVKVPDTQTCNSDRISLNTSLICNCQIPDIPLKNIWQWYEEPGNYGLEVKAQDLQHSAKMGIDGDLFHAYFVPSLSGMQLFGLSKSSPTHCMDVRNTMYGNLPILSTLLPKPAIADDSTPEYLGSSSDLCAHYEKHVCSCDATSENIYLLFEFFECEQPHQRRPMFDKIKELTRSGVDSSSQHSGDPCILNSLKIGDLHPASWFAVAWYPIYRVPEGQLRTAFLTYHSLGRFAHRNSCCDPVGGTSSSIVAPAVGLQSYSSQAECWFHLRECYANFHVEEIPSEPSEIMQDRLRTLEETAASMSRGLTKTETPSQRSKHSDYDFFNGRRG